jgi:hypothetical protein
MRIILKIRFKIFIVKLRGKRENKGKSINRIIENINILILQNLFLLNKYITKTI